MEKIKFILAIVFTAVCWASLCLDWDLATYLSAIAALCFIGASGKRETPQNESEGKEEI